jgi:uncharacterized protein (TIGR02996 family)
MTTTNTAQGLLADIIEHPEADDLRLIYADWLEDHGEEERAALIRWMLADARVEAKFKHKPEDGNYFTCWSDHSLEGNPYRPRWRGEIAGSWACSMRIAMVGTDDIPDEPPFGITDDFTVVFRRGFVAEVHAPIAVLQQHLPALVRQHPIERVRATDKEPDQYAALSDLWPEHWSWWSDNDNNPSSVQKQVWSLIDGFDPGYTSLEEECRNYPTAEAAHEALSVALLKLARRS